MPEALTDDLGMNAGPQRQGRMGVPEVVQADLGQPRRLQRHGEGTAHDLGVQGLAVLLGEHAA